MGTGLKGRLVLIALVAITGGLIVAFFSLHGYGATLLLADLARIDLPLPDTRPEIGREELFFDTGGRRQAADLYRPPGKGRAGLVLVPGAAEGGRRDARLVEFATALARSGFVVLAPDIPSLRELQLTPGNAREILDAVLLLKDSGYFSPDQRLGVAAFSVASGPAVLAALDPRDGSRIDFLLLVGGYLDLERTLVFLTTGYFETAEGAVHREPDSYGKWVYTLGNANRLQDPSDRRVLAELARRKLADPESDTAALQARLGPEGRSVRDFIENTDPARARALMRGLPATVQADIAALNLATRDLAQTRARFILVHGLDDDIIPYTESISLAAALPPGRAGLYLLPGLHHVDREFSGRDAWRMWRALQDLLSQRDAAGDRK
jgi:pimeloyl-ACP methyl ester carboxylesterase